MKLMSNCHCVTSCIESLEEYTGWNKHFHWKISLHKQPVTGGLTATDWAKTKAWMSVNIQLKKFTPCYKYWKKKVACQWELLFCHLNATSVRLWNNLLKYRAQAALANTHYCFLCLLLALWKLYSTATDKKYVFASPHNLWCRSDIKV